MRQIGSLDLSKTNAIEGRMSVQNGYSPVLGLSLLDTDAMNLTQGILLDREVGKLRIVVELFELKASSDLYSNAVLLGENMAMCHRWPSNWGASIAGIEPLPYAWPGPTAGGMAQFPQGRDSFPLKNGQLSGNRDYGIRISVVEPILVTNQGCFWIYSARPKRWWDSIPGPWRSPKKKPK